MQVLEFWILGTADSPLKTGFLYSLVPFKTGFTVYVMSRKCRRSLWSSCDKFYYKLEIYVQIYQQAAGLS